MILKVTPSKFQVEDWFVHVVVGMFVLQGHVNLLFSQKLFWFKAFFSTDPCQKVFCPATEQRHNLPCQKGYPTRVALDKRAMGGGGGKGGKVKGKGKKESLAKGEGKESLAKGSTEAAGSLAKGSTGEGKGSLAKGPTEGVDSQGKAWGFNNKWRPAGSGTVSHKRRDKYRLRQRNREELNAKGIRTPSQERAALEEERREEEEEEEQRKEEEALAFLDKRKRQRDEAALGRRNQEEEKKKKEQEAALDKRKEEEKKQEQEAALDKRKEEEKKKEEEAALDKRKQEEEEKKKEAALDKRKEEEKKKEEEAALDKRSLEPSEKELQKQKMVAKEENWVEVVKKGKKRPSPSPNADWGGSSSSSSPSPCRKDPVPPAPCQKEAAPLPKPCQKVPEKLVLKEKAPEWVAVDWFRTVEHPTGWWDRKGFKKLKQRGIKIWILSFAGRIQGNLVLQKCSELKSEGLIDHCSIVASKCGPQGKAAIMQLWGVGVLFDDCKEIMDESLSKGIRVYQISPKWAFRSLEEAVDQFLLDYA